MDDKITIIEGPPPIFEPVNDGWALGLNESPHIAITVMTRLRTFNGHSLVERCYRCWNAKHPIHLVYKNELGLQQESPIVAARSVDTDEGQVLLLWINLDHEKVEYEFGDDEDDEAGDQRDQ
jgi:hypothetical protein